MIRASLPSTLSGVPEPLKDFCFPAPDGSLFRCMTTGSGPTIHHVTLALPGSYKTQSDRSYLPANKIRKSPRRR